MKIQCHHKLNSGLFQDLLNFDDPLNVEAAEHYERDKVSIPYSAE